MKRLLPAAGLAIVALATWLSHLQQQRGLAAEIAPRTAPIAAQPVATIPAIEAAAPPEAMAPASAPRRERYSNHRDVSPLDEIDLAVGLNDDERTVVVGLVISREAQMHEAYAEVVADGRDRQEGIQAVSEIYEFYHARIRAALRPDQQAKLDEGRRAGKIGRPMFVFVYGSQDPTHP